MNNNIINLEGEFINIEDEFYRGSSQLFNECEELNDFSIVDSSGFFSINDILLYELRKFSDTLGTFPKEVVTKEEYCNLLRNHIDSKAYRFMGFISIDSIDGYLQKFSRNRRININRILLRDIVSKSIFKKFISDGLSKDHPVILQLRRRNPNKFPKYSVITGINENTLTFSMDGYKKEIKLDDVFDFQDLELGLLYIELNDNEEN